MDSTRAYLLKGPRPGEVWSVGGYENLVFLGVGRDFCQEKHFVFKDGEGMFVITKDDFYAADLFKEKQFSSPHVPPGREYKCRDCSYRCIHSLNVPGLFFSTLKWRSKFALNLGCSS